MALTSRSVIDTSLFESWNAETLKQGILNKRAQEAKDAAAQVANGAKKAADTIFSGMGTDELLAVDTYAIRDTLTKNSLFEAAKDNVDAATAMIRKRTGIVTEAVNLARSALSSVVSRVEQTKRLAMMLGQQGANALGKLTQAAQDSFYAVLNNPLIRAGKDLVKTSIDGVNYYSKASCIGHLGGITGLLGDLLGNTSLSRLFDLHLESALFASILEDALGCGVNAFDTIKTAASDDSVWQNAFALSSGKAIEVSNLEGLSAMIDSIGADPILGQNPNAVGDILSNYTLASGTTADQYAAKFTELDSVLTRLDPNWDTVKIGSSNVVDYSVFSTASADAQTVLSSSAEFRTVAVAAPSFQQVSVQDLMKSMYPLGAIA